MSFLNTFSNRIRTFLHYLLGILILLVCIPYNLSALINPEFTPVELAVQSKSIIHLRFLVSGDTSSMTSDSRDVLKGEDPGITAIKVPFYLRSKLVDVVESGTISAVLITGDYGDAGVGGSGTVRKVKAMLKTDSGWYGVYGEKEPYILGEDPLDLRAVWAGSADMLASAFKYVFSDPGRAEIPVRVGVKWESAGKYNTRLRNVHALLPVMTSEGKRLLFVASSGGDKLLEVDGSGKISEASSGTKLSSRSLKAAWSDMNADGKHDLLSWTGEKYSLYSFSADACSLLCSEPGSATLYSLCGAVLEPGKAAAVIAGTEAGPQVIRFTSDGRKLLVTPVTTLSDKKVGGPCAVADFTGDGVNDIAEITKTHILLYKGKGRGQYSLPIESGETYDLSFRLQPLVCDINGDGHLDLIVSGADGAEPYINLGNGEFMNMMPVSGELTYVGKPGVKGSCTADFNNDGKQEFILFYKDLGPLPFFNRGFACFGYASELELRESGLSVSDAIMRGQQAGLTADMDGDGKQETMIVTAEGDLIVLEIASRLDRPILALEVSPAYGGVSPSAVNANARSQIMGARNAGIAFPAFFGIRRKGPVDLSSKDEKGNAVSIRKIVIKPTKVRIKPVK